MASSPEAVEGFTAGAETRTASSSSLAEDIAAVFVRALLADASRYPLYNSGASR